MKNGLDETTIDLLVKFVGYYLEDLRKRKEYELADLIRDTLVDKGFTISHHKIGTIILKP